MAQFQFLGTSDRSGRFPIHIYPIDIVKIREESDHTIALEPNNPELEDFCYRDSHSRECLNIMDMFPLPCIMDQAKAARRRKKRLDVLYLLRECARDPLYANGLRTLEGLAKEAAFLTTSKYKI